MKETRKIRMYLRMPPLVILFPIVVNAGNSPAIPDGWSDVYVYANGIRIH
jgi:hypothetical protein